MDDRFQSIAVGDEQSAGKLALEDAGDWHSSESAASCNCHADKHRSRARSSTKAKKEALRRFHSTLQRRQGEKDALLLNRR